MKKNIVLLIVLTLSVFSSNLFAQKPKPNPNTPVTSTILDADFNVYNIQSDYRTTSQNNYQNGLDSVVSQIQGIGDWELSLLSSLNRRVYVGFDQPVLGSNPAPIANAFYPVRFITQCSKNLTTLAAGEPQECPLIVAINVGPDRYSLRFHSANFPGSNNVGWTCNSAPYGKCNSWTMQSKPVGNVAQLLKIETVNRKTVNTSYGFYNFNFSVNVSNP